MKIKRRKKPYCCKNVSTLRHWYGRSANNTFEPSSGGIGTKLNTASTRFIKTISEKISMKFCAMSEFPPNANVSRMSTPNTSATTILESGPAAPTNAGPQSLRVPKRTNGFRKLYGLYGTGFAQPIKNGEFASAKSIGKITEPNGSKCFRGFSVRRPKCFAVGSPKARAASPCDTSWITTEKIRMAI